MTKKINQFGQNPRKGRVVNTVSASFNNITRQMTEKSQRKKTGFCIVLLKTCEPL